MIHGSDYLSKLYNDLITNTPQTFSMNISSEFGQVESHRLRSNMVLFFRIGRCAINRIQM